MTELSDLRGNFRYVRLLPPREDDHPEDARGNDDDPYARRDQDGGLRLPAWQGHRAFGRVRHFTHTYQLARMRNPERAATGAGQG